MWYRSYLKRCLDLTIAITALLMLSPLFLVVTLLLLVANDGKPFFLQPRPGKGARVFRVIKFRTMNDRKDSTGNLLPDADRLTATGRIVRATSLDEIPQLLNVILGDMSLVGPRPLLVSYLPLYDEEQQRRHAVRPGITGWAQVNGRNAIGWDQKFAFDVWYVDHVSFGLDLRILLLTVRKVIRPEGISNEGHATMPFFEGNR